MAALKKYNAKEVVLVWDDSAYTEGIVDGTFITISRSQPNSTLNKGADNGGTMVIINDTSTTVTATYRKGSQVNDRLTDIVIQDEADNSLKRVGPMRIEDFSGRTLHFGEGAFLIGPPDDEFANDESEVTWTWMVNDMSLQVRGSNDAGFIPSSGNV